MSLSSYLRGVVDWLRAGYPHGVPDTDYQPLLALLARRLSDEEVEDVCNTLVLEGYIPPDRADVAVELTKVLGELPSEDSIERVLAHLEATGWPVTWDRPGGAAPDDPPGHPRGDDPTGGSPAA